MKANADTIPEPLIKSRGKTQINHNVEEITVEDPDGKQRTAYEYDMVEIDGEVTRDKIISAILTMEYPVDAQLAILFNNAMAKDVADYDAYQTKRAQAKNIADSIITLQKKTTNTTSATK